MSATTPSTRRDGAPACAPEDAGPPPPGDWLYQEGGRVYGPVAGQGLVELIWAGRIGRATPVSSREGSWCPLAEAPGALLHLAKAEARARVVADLRRARRRAAARRVGAVSLVAAVVVSGGWLAASWSSRSRADLLDDLGPGLALGPVRVGASDRAVSDEIAVPGPPHEAGSRAPAGPPGGRPELRPGKPHDRRVASASPARGGGPGAAREATSGGGARPAEPATGDVAGGELVMTRYDPRRIEEAVARQRSSLAPCLREEAQRSPDFSGEIPIEFAIANDGKVAALWIDEPRFKTGPLRECLLQRLGRWSFEPFPGARPVVSLAFRVGPP